jgi:hypothetical protein
MLALPYLPTIYIKEWSLPPLAHLMHAIYLLQAEFQTEICRGFSGHVYKGLLSFPLLCSWSAPVCRGFIPINRDGLCLLLTSSSPSLLAIKFSCMLLVFWCHLASLLVPPCCICGLMVSPLCFSMLPYFVYQPP